MKKGLFLVFCLCLSLLPLSVGNAADVGKVTIYKWVDKDGVVNFTDDYDKIPPAYRNRIQKEDVREEKITPPRTPGPISPRGKEKETNFLRLDETYWKERVRPWKERLREATANYEATNNKVVEKKAELDRIKFAAQETTSSIITYEVGQLEEEMKKYEAQITEANEMLKKISKEAAEAKADPNWLK